MIAISKAGDLAALFALLCGALTGCADLTVTPVTKDNEATVKGVRYYLPKPFIVFAPQADGTVVPNVVYLPDKSHEYAIETNSTLSSYAFQASTDPNGLLTGVQYNTDTTAVSAQAAASAGAGAAQVLNYEAARSVAVQTQVNTAQANVITAQSAYSSALAALNSDTQANVATPGTVSQSALQADASTVAQKQAALQVAQAALQASQTTPQAVAGTAAAGTPISTTAAAPGTAFSAPAWGPGLSLNLPDRFGPIWYAVNVEGSSTSLVAVRALLTGEPKPVAPATSQDPQQAFDTTLSALGPPQIPVPTAPFTLASHLPAAFMFNRPVTIHPKSDLSVTDIENRKDTRAVANWDNQRTLTLDISKLKPGGYWLNVTFHYPVDPAHPDVLTTGFQKILFDVTAK